MLCLPNTILIISNLISGSGGIPHIFDTFVPCILDIQFKFILLHPKFYWRPLLIYSFEVIV